MASGDPASVSDTVREQIRASDRNLPVFSAMTMEDLRRLGYWEYALFGWVFGTIGIVGLVLELLATLPIGLGWLVLGPVIAASVYTGYRDIYLR